jgi:hypothetical protein
MWGVAGMTLLRREAWAPQGMSIQVRKRTNTVFPFSSRRVSS